MARLSAFSLFIIYPLILAFLPSALAGPACAKRNAGSESCVAKCGSKWGWSGRAMGNDPWGQVMTVTLTDMGSVVTKACRVRPSSSGLSGPSSAVTTASALSAVGNVGNSVPTLTAVISSSSEPTSSVVVTTSSSSILSSSIRSANSLLLSPPSSFISIRRSTSSSAPTPTPAPPPPPPSSSEKPSEVPTIAAQSSRPPAPQPTTKSSPPPAPRPTTQNTPPPQKPTTSEAPAPSPTGASSSSDSTSSSDIDQYLTAHNSIRSQHGASPLTWSDDLASKAQQWANGCVFQHSGGTLGPFGGATCLDEWRIVLTG
ncbi:hypothetical protein PHLCEN_2v11738 [Hermanssonia centrifuga]|uniref:SCP domain-containing protein n=1 Tax=Hermanssonia centrifuga TaxID=98765 RepID=A0A2R6NJ32_9APHY|nr:hypothetical protein PHLCEN_2v11738 [Hermanssonia centrifuga]